METISPWLLLVISVLACLLGGIARTYFCKSLVTSTRSYYLYNGANSAVCALALWLLGGGGALQLSAFSLWFGVLFGLVTMAQGITYSAALHCGPWSYTSVISSLSTIIPAISGALFWHESISFLQIFGILLMLVCFVLSVDPGKDEGRAASLRWLVLCMVAFVFSGAIGVMQKVHQTSVYKQELSGFLIVAFLASAAVSLLVCLFYPRARQAEAAPATPAADTGKAGRSTGRTVWLVLVLFAIGGVTAALNNQFNLYLSGVMPSAVFFPIVNGGGLVLSTAASVLLFREKLSVRQWIGLAMGTVSVLMLCM